MTVSITFQATTPGASTFALDVDPTLTVLEVKSLAAEKAGLEPAHMTIIFNGQVLADTETLEHHKVESGSVFLVVKSAPSASSPKASASPAAATTPAPEVAPPATQTAPAAVADLGDLAGLDVLGGTSAEASPQAASPPPPATGGGQAGLGDLSALEALTAPTPAAAAPAGAAAAPAAGAPAAMDLFGDDEWDTFQSAPATALPQASSGGSPATTSAAAVAGSPAAADETFDPLASPAAASPAAATAAAPAIDPYGGIEALGAQKRGDDNLISMNPLDEFDPVAQSWGQDPPAAAAAAAAPAAVQAAPAAQAPSPTTASAPSQQASNVVDDGDLLGLGGGSVPRSSNEAPPEDDEDIGKKVIYVYHKGEKNVVGWYNDMDPADIKEAVLCACDAIMDGGFVLREVQFAGEDETMAEPKEDGRIYQFEDFDQLENGQTYIIESSQEREDLKKFTGDRWRRLRVQIEPLLHVEANKAIDRMRRGSNLLKHTHYGFPHLRQFQLSDDRKRLVWYSGAKRKEDSVVNLDEVQEIRLGQTTPVFLHYRLPMLEHLSFSLVYGPKGTKTLDLTCKDEFEFDHWVTGLKAIFYHFKNRLISKEALLGHSKRFRKALEKNNVGIKLTKLPEVKEKGHVGLDDCIEIVTHTPQQLDTKMERLRERLKTMGQQVARLDHHSSAEMEVDLSLLTGQGPAYASVFVQDEDAQDEEMEIRRMHELVDQTTQVLQQARNELIALNQRQRNEASSSTDNNGAKGRKKENAACKHIDQLLWKAEVDLENVEDMYLRHIDNQRETATTFSVSIADMNQRFSQAATEIEETVSKRFEEFRSWFR
mmetsp:Transcript_16961/g.36745  ORF Transcript_16961/g.36745 Transcript_16961/m.36745 type:complete len:826 (+) Transcript_16961:148-2625(+)